jgi:selenide, water dikinase
VKHENLLVGFDTGDDAAVYRLTDDLCIVTTVDFFPPIVDDPYDFGAIAAVNALSDVYAMGGQPIMALNLLCFPEDLPKRILAKVLEGGMDVAIEAGVVIAGGHTVKDKEPKYGMSVTGTVAPDKIVTNAGAKVGDVLVLTKRIGTGIITTAAKADATDAKTLAGAVASMRMLNKAGAEAMTSVGVSAATDITGFGLIGHLLGMMKASGVTARLQTSAVPLLDGTRELAERGVVPGGTWNNLTAFNPRVRWAPAQSEVDKLLLCDAQTSGGLLIAVPPSRLDALRQELTKRGVAHAIVGDVIEHSDIRGVSHYVTEWVQVER